MGNQPTVLKEGVFKCSVASQEAYLEDIYSCILFQLPYQLENIYFSYISAILLLIIILISLFGRIKLHYRWFILNQAIIDILTCHDFICSKFGGNRGRNHQTCYYTGWLRDCIEYYDIIFKLPCLALFLLTGSRFLAVYFSRIYKKFTKNWIIILGIFLINTVYIIFNFSHHLLNNIWHDGFDKFMCLEEDNATLNEIYEITKNCAPSKTVYMFMDLQNRIDRIIPILAIFFAIVFVSLLILRIRRQIKFQKETNKEILKSSIRVAAVFTIQTFILLFIFAIDFFNELWRNEIFVPSRDSPKWINWLIHENTVRASRLIRVFIDSILILAFMGGYREDLFFAILWILNIPKTVLKKLKRN